MLQRHMIVGKFSSERKNSSSHGKTQSHDLRCFLSESFDEPRIQPQMCLAQWLSLSLGLASELITTEADISLISGVLSNFGEVEKLQVTCRSCTMWCDDVQLL
jgi:hypothetical protein